ncbi:hypothetical protein BU23DRAFT_90438 [Bimuria novae-zelandiae CBS 107.79]|uniref:Uncharacterized protein n=1 Tax=Bimuria novae-zelandiae CBS 107.79 TaxID=1447943 RepID=A0A6A5VC84_9PLEO|nr:hypothetical protein BU23DRAFT_90438 [Bimuria novae-zelandiae CBS 107.79]
MDSQAVLSQASQGSALMPSTEESRPATPSMRSESRSDTSEPAQYTKAEKFTSPAPRTTSSMTPPPSSQVPNTRSALRTPTPPTPGLSSPPPTSKLPNQPSALVESAAALFSQEQISNASADELRAMVNDLSGKLRDVRLSAAHHKLQYNMAVMESQESASRMAVELAMAQREIDVLQKAEEKRRSQIPTPEQIYQESPMAAANAILMSEMNRQIQMLQNENEELRDLYEQQKRLTEHRDGEIRGLVDENDRLKSRIRKNRDHMAPYLPYLEQMNESPRSTFGTPHATPRHKVNRVSAIPHENRGQNNFEALLLADKMLSQETGTAPSTPARYGQRSRFSHTRGAQSMSSLPHTPRGHSTHAVEIPRTPTTFAPVSIPQSAPAAHYIVKAAHARRESSNSTITASSVDEEEAFTDIEDEEVTESQASQLATSMLRRAPTGSKPTGSKPTGSKRASAPTSQSHLVQSKIFGQVKKGHGLTRSAELEKKRLQPSDHHESPTKRGRLEGGIGLGIGLGLRD